MKLTTFYEAAKARVEAMEEDLRRCKEAFKETASYFGEDGDALAALGGSEPAAFFQTLLKFVQSIKKAKDDRQRVEHCMDPDKRKGGAGGGGPAGGGAAGGRGGGGRAGGAGPLLGFKVRTVAHQRSASASVGQ